MDINSVSIKLIEELVKSTPVLDKLLCDIVATGRRVIELDGRLRLYGSNVELLRGVQGNILSSSDVGLLVIVIDISAAVSYKQLPGPAVGHIPLAVLRLRCLDGHHESYYTLDSIQLDKIGLIVEYNSSLKLLVEDMGLELGRLDGELGVVVREASKSICS